MYRLKKTNKTLKRVFILTVVVFIISTLAIGVFASEGGISTGISGVDNGFSSLINMFVGICKIGGVFLGIYGVIQLGLGFHSHDATQKINAVFYIAGALLLFFVKDILSAFGIII